MKKILIFAGTTEGRELARVLSEYGIPSIVSVATEYGLEVMPDYKNVDQKMGRLDVAQMCSLIKTADIAIVVDATHPFATEVSRNIKTACENCSVRYMRLRRDTLSETSSDNIEWFEDTASCEKALHDIEGNILLTTGSKELSVYCKDETLRERIYARVLPGEESIALCKAAGLSGKHIIAMQGPFCEELNIALIKQFNISIMVTKESGRTGGLDEKVKAADVSGVKLFVIGAPTEEDGLKSQDVVDLLLKEYSIDISEADVPVQEENRLQSYRVNGQKIVLVGIGMGNPDYLTVAAKKAIDEADYILGAQRMIEPFHAKIEKKAIYLTRDIVPYIKDKTGKICILFSGDSGFYSGCRRLREGLEEAGYKDIAIIPGISSVSYMSAVTGIPWSEAEIFSVHGAGEPEKWRGKLYKKVSESEKTFLLLSGIRDVNEIGKMLSGKDNYKIILASNLSYEDEKIEELTPLQCELKTEESLYACIILNDCPKKTVIMNSHSDEDFIRAKVPMTKEEIRTVSISKLGLERDSVVWDVGSGTGSIAVEIAGYSPEIKVYAIEHKEEAVQLIEENCKKFDVLNVNIINGKAPDALQEIPAPDCVFIGGSGGELEDILALIYERNKNTRVVLNAVSLETIAQVTNLLPKLKLKDFQSVTMSVSRSRALGRYNLLRAENPVMIFAFTFTE